MKRVDDLLKYLEGYSDIAVVNKAKIHQELLLIKKEVAAINYTHSCKSDSEQLHTEVFNLANKLAINGYGNEAVKMHGICNGM
jgi:hypothetical protein